MSCKVCGPGDFEGQHTIVEAKTLQISVCKYNRMDCRYSLGGQEDPWSVLGLLYNIVNTLG